jgi:hypothetical protein
VRPKRITGGLLAEDFWSGTSSKRLVPQTPKILDIGTSTGSNLRYCEISVFDRRFDLVRATGVIEHVIDDLGTLRVRRVLKPAGISGFRFPRSIFLEVNGISLRNLLGTARVAETLALGAFLLRLFAFAIDPGRGPFDAQRQNSS